MAFAGQEVAASVLSRLKPPVAITRASALVDLDGAVVMMIHGANGVEVRVTYSGPEKNRFTIERPDSMDVMRLQPGGNAEHLLLAIVREALRSEPAIDPNLTADARAHLLIRREAMEKCLKVLEARDHKE
ncbi:MAG TPA: hypothetical protein VG733_05470 [Chthoniobacteraceae bacterium]|nr:hypothetical protein [Chthoniobacteraceae bacterium]